MKITKKYAYTHERHWKEETLEMTLQQFNEELGKHLFCGNELVYSHPEKFKFRTKNHPEDTSSPLETIYIVESTEGIEL